MKGNFAKNGFTIIELLIVVGIIGFLAAVALPSFSGMISRMSSNSAARSIAGTFNFARSEAVKRGRAVSICATTNGLDCAADSWSSGWIVFVDTNNSGVTGAAGSIQAGIDEVIQVYQPLANMALSSSVDLLQYSARGFGLNTVIIDFDICPNDNTMVHARRLRVGLSGRVRLIEGVGC